MGAFALDLFEFCPQGSSPCLGCRSFYSSNARRAAKRVGLVAVLIAAALGMVLLNFQAFSGAMRADKSLRYQIVPAIMVYSLVRTLTG